jgi:hypothetical protein
MTKDELIALMLDALEDAETQLDQISGGIEEENDPEFYETLSKVKEVIFQVNEHEVSQ